MMGCGRRVPGAIAAPTGRHPRMVSEHSRGSARLTALARAISETRPGNGSLEVEQRVCKIVGYVTELAGRDLHPLGRRCLITAHFNIMNYIIFSYDIQKIAGFFRDCSIIVGRLGGPLNVN